ncbi:hypothetical protein AG4045_003932 [Apium graveolens]|uniref:Uncharacterized protein n=1 Tax=Apium graveolens TaxID=4045 RepID=A0A6L5BAA2_APIGR|nr:hypothetical protein AG4045_003932 [Apium graveolens]
MYEVMKCMFKQNSFPGEETRGCVEGTGTTPSVYSLLDVKFMPGDTNLGSEIFNRKRLNNLDKSEKDDKISQLDNKLIHIFIMKNKSTCVEACELKLCPLKFFPGPGDKSFFFCE